MITIVVKYLGYTLNLMLIQAILGLKILETTYYEYISIQK